ncbi:MAG: hypothetical protein ACXVFZ_14440 [Blastococcus sp.]
MTRLRPTLDDVTYADLVARARARIPSLAPDWTDHNPADPGITLVELFAFLAEMLVYQADQLPPDRTDTFLALLNGPGWTRTTDLDTAVAATLAALRSPWRAATADDVVALLTAVWPDGDASRTRVRRARCVAERDLTGAPDGDQPAPGRLSIVVVPEPEADAPGLPVASADLCAAVLDWLEPRRLLGVRHHVLPAPYVPITLTARLVIREDYAPVTVARSGVLTDDAIAREAGRQGAAAIAAHLHPLTGGDEGTGWPFGRDVHASELYAVLDRLPGVDFVDGLRFLDTPAARRITVGGEVVGVRLASHELVEVTVVDDAGRSGQLQVTWSRLAGDAP